MVIEKGLDMTVQNHHDEEDVPAALARKTDDGPGTDDISSLPESDFDGYAESDVEEEDDS